MEHDPLIYSVFLIFTGAALVATVALFLRQSLLVGYILLGMMLGPWGIGLVNEPQIIKEISHIGIIFLLFLLGLNLYPQKLVQLFRETLIVTLLSSTMFALVGYLIGMLFGFSQKESLIIGIACMFSSTILGLKLLPATQLHHQHTGELIISVLLLQDVIAITVLLFLKTKGGDSGLMVAFLQTVVAFPLFIGGSLLFSRYIIVPLFARFDTIQEYVFLLTIGWCLGAAELAALVGMSQEIGAFIAGVAIASSPISPFIAESLRPLRDFFLIMFFFALGATFDLGMITEIIVPVITLGAILVILKPIVFRQLFQMSGESDPLSMEVGVRLGQISEFSMFIAILAIDSGIVSSRASYLIQLTTLFTFFVSSYWIMLRYPTPIAVSDRLRRD
jgi:Kef-type K+ transport system membrane component KefB